MVLVTSSAISVAVSSAIVCTFTFLLFLSGYVLQQQTVRSIQEAIRKPPEPAQIIPIPTLPQTFDNLELDNEDKKALTDLLDQMMEQSNAQDFDQTILSGIPAANGPTGQDVESNGHLAYLLALPTPSTLCSAYLFTKWQWEQTRLNPRATVVYLYPSNWDASSLPEHTAALKLMREIQEEYLVLFHPVQISSAFAGISIETQLLGEIQRKRWEYERAIYLKSPGFLQDTTKLDGTLRKSNLKTSWTSLSASAGHSPDIMFVSQTKGLLTPRGDMRKITSSAITSHSNHHEDEMDVEASAKSAAYVVFDEQDLEHRKGEKEWYGGVVERFTRERAKVCRGTGLLDGNSDDKVTNDLRRRSELHWL